MKTTIQNWKCILTSRSVPDNDKTKVVTKSRRSTSHAPKLLELTNPKTGLLVVYSGWRGMLVAYFLHRGAPIGLVLTMIYLQLTLYTCLIMQWWCCDTHIWSFMCLYICKWGSIQNPSLVWRCQKTPRIGLP